MNKGCNGIGVTFIFPQVIDILRGKASRSASGSQPEPSPDQSATNSPESNSRLSSNGESLQLGAFGTLEQFSWLLPALTLVSLHRPPVLAKLLTLAVSPKGCSWLPRDSSKLVPSHNIYTCLPALPRSPSRPWPARTPFSSSRKQLRRMGGQTRTHEEGPPCPVGTTLLETVRTLFCFPPAQSLGPGFAPRHKHILLSTDPPNRAPCPGLSAPLNLRHPGSQSGIH